MTCSSAACIGMHKVSSISLDVQAYITSMVAYGSVQVGMGVVHYRFEFSTVSLVGAYCCVEISSRAGSIVRSTAQL